MNKKGFQQVKHLFPFKRYLLFLCTVFFCMQVTGVYAQAPKVSLDMQNAKLKQVLDNIEKQTNYFFVYDKKVNVEQTVSIKAESLALESLLHRLLDKIGIVYKIENKTIALSVKAPDEPRKVTGNVVDVRGEPMIGATVIIQGTTTGVTTDVQGNFSIGVPSPETAVLAFGFLGYKPANVKVGAQSHLKVVMEEESVAMEEVVVTALGIKRSEKALSYNVQKVASDEILTVKDANFVNALNGKVAGVNINSSSSGVGGASKVVMRGAKSINQSSNALYVIDGVPMYTFAGKDTKGQDTKGQEFDSKGSTEAIADINPEDIESLTVLTGAAAAALYGSEAANGAIVITTKQGKKGKTSVTLTSNTEILMPLVMPEFQNRYGTSEGNKSWGSKLNSANYIGYKPQDDYFQTGVVGTETISLSTGNEKNQTYLSASAVNSRGLVPNNRYDRYNFTFRNTTSFFNDQMKLDLGGSYIRQKDRNMTNQGVYSNPLVSAYLFPRGDDWADIEMFERYDMARKIYTQYWPSGEGTYVMQNPYWINYRNLRENDKERYMFNAGLSYEVTDWLSLSGRLRLDNTVNDFTEKFYATTNTLLTEGSDNGLYGIERTKDRQIYGDVLANINKTFGEFSLHANIGGSFSDLRSDGLKNRGPIAYGLLIAVDKDGNEIREPNNIPNVFNLYQLSNSKTLREQTGWHDQTQSVFASVELGYKDTYYLTVTGRNDWPSQLAGPKSKNKSFFYPSVGGSVVLSQFFELPKTLSYLKVRGSFASVGVAFKRFLAYPTHEWDEANKVWVSKTDYPMYNLKPERTKSWEIGLTARFLKHFSLDMSYYNTKTSNQTFNPQISVSSGWKNIYIQTGNVRNQGVELALGYKNTWKNFTWSSDYTLSVNRNKILSLANNAVNPITGELFSVDHLDVGGLGQTRFVLKEGGSLGDLYSTSDLVRDSNGDVYVDAEGNFQTLTSIKDFEKFIKLGSVFPKANMSWRNDFRWKNWNLGFMFSARLGGVVFSRTQAALDYYGVSKASADARDAGGVLVNGRDVIDAEKWYTTIGNQDGIPQFYTYSATNIRLQEASIGYTIPRKKLGNIMDITLSVVGRNLWMVYNKAPFDPEAVASTGNYYQGIDYFMMPNTRNIGFNLRLNF